ncbi:MAG: AraC family transcriptional regulator [Cyanobacteria bacterium CRU_2_1]|nr:AraC family transcriptional regulator [Cyanobacteria bacterium RU_5_0]NJR63465.1 AraC family transcriptional regulator [Cyanobacteria bacterium CRU_2_1]
MSQAVSFQRSPQLAIHPLNFYDDRRISSRQTVITRGLIVEYQLQKPVEFITSGLTHHVLPFRLDKVDRQQAARIDNQECKGLYLPGEFLFCPAYTPGFSAFLPNDNPVEAIVFMAEPTVLQQTAAETHCLHPHQVELLGTPKTRDPQIAAIATLFLNEINTGGLGGLVYAESLANLFLIHLLRHYCAFEPKLKQYPGGLSSHKLQQAIDYIQANLDQKLSLDAIA